MWNHVKIMFLHGLDISHTLRSCKGLPVMHKGLYVMHESLPVVCLSHTMTAIVIHAQLQ